MSDPFHIAARTIRSGRRICADCGARYQLALGATGEIDYCDTCRARRTRLIEHLAEKFHLIPKEALPKTRQESTGPQPTSLQKCSDCGKEFQPLSRGGMPLDSCCEECHGKRVNMVDDIADQSFRGWNLKTKSSSRRRIRVKWAGLSMLLLATIIVATWFGARPAKQFYHHWREERHLARATAFFERADYKHAMLDAKNTLAFNVENKDAVRIMARSLEALHAPQALEWRARLGQLAPNDLENSLGWASAAIQNGDHSAADRVLRRIPFADHDTARFHHLSALVALNKRDSTKAEYHWSEASKLNADEDGYKLNMAALRLKLGSAVERSNALDLLNQLRVNSKERIPAMRALLSDALRHGENAQARQLAVALAEDPKAPFSDKLIRLSTLRTLKDPDFPLWRTRLEAEAADRADYAYEMLIWMNRNGYATEVPALLPKINPEFITQPPVCIAVADSYAVTKNWPELQKSLKASKWLHMEYVRLATLAWAMDQSGERQTSAGVWKNATSAAEGRLERMETLARAAMTWGWGDRAEEVLWSITAKSVQSPTWVLHALWARSLKSGDTGKLRNVARLMFQANPRSITARNNYIFLSLLKRTDDGSPHQAAEALHKENPTVPSVVSTYGLSLFLLDRSPAAVEVMETLTPAQLREPAVAIYYGIFLAGAKRTAKADEYLQLGAKWNHLLPEEEALLERVLQKRNTPSPLTPSQKVPPVPQPSAQ